MSITYGRIDASASEPVSHDPAIFKQVLLKAGDLQHLQQLAVATLEPGQQTTSHVHSDMAEVFVVQAGAGWFLSEGEQRRLEVGSWLHIPAGHSHAFRSEGPAPLVLLYFGVAA